MSYWPSRTHLGITTVTVAPASTSTQGSLFSGPSVLYSRSLGPCASESAGEVVISADSPTQTYLGHDSEGVPSSSVNSPTQNSRVTKVPGIQEPVWSLVLQPDYGLFSLQSPTGRELGFPESWHLEYHPSSESTSRQPSQAPPLSAGSHFLSVKDR